MKARIEVLLVLEVEFEQGDKQDVHNFLANNVSYMDAFLGVSDPDQTMRVTDVMCLEEDVTDMDYEEEQE